MQADWSAERWCRDLEQAASRRDYGALHALRQLVFATTVEAVRARAYDVGDTHVPLDSSNEYAALHEGTVFYDSTDALEVPPERRRRFETDIRVVNGDCLDVAAQLVSSGAFPAVLNMANRHNPGGGVLGGAGAQEENLFRRSNLLWSLYQFAPYAPEYGVPSHPGGRSYPIPRESGGIYSPGATIFRSSEATGYAFLADPFRVAFVTMPAINGPPLTRCQGEMVLAEPFAAATLRKIRGILRIAAAHDHTHLVLSAFGCGAFRNPPRHVARLFREALAEDEFQGAFQEVVFAIFDDHNAFKASNPEGNFAPFAQVFGEVTG